MAGVDTTSDERPEVAILIPVFGVGGAERVVAELLQGLPREHYRLTLMTLAEKGLSLPLPADVRVESIRARRFMTALPKVIAIIRRRPPDLLCAHMTLANLWALVARAVTRRQFPVICVEHNMPTEEYSRETRRRRALPTLMRALYRQADRLVTISDGARADLAAVLRISEQQILVIRNPVLPPQLPELAAEAAPHPWFDDSSLRVVLAVGRLAPQKNYPLLLRAFATVAAADERARLIVYGEGTLRDELDRLARTLGVEERVAFPGIIANPYAAMSRATVYAISSHYEGSPLSVIEALACGARVVATDVGDIGDLLALAQSGTVVAPGDEAAFARALMDAINRDSPPAIAVEALEPFRVARGVQAYDELFAEVLGERLVKNRGSTTP
jgi:glycosyltransferase involved in cell wall biosynthesis